MHHRITNYAGESDEKKNELLEVLSMGTPKPTHKVSLYKCSFGMVIADDQYYKKPLEARRDILSAPSVDFLCKTIVFENTAYD